MAGSKKGRRTKSTLTAETEAAIVREYWARRWHYGAKTYLARKFGVSRQTIHNVLNRCEYDKHSDEVIRIDLSSLPFDDGIA